MGIPQAVADALAGELEALRPAARLVLQGAAVAGEPFDPELAAAAGEVPIGDALPALDELLTADLVRPGDPRRFTFRHPLVRRAVYAGAGGGWRLGAHARVSSALQRRGATATLRAHHLQFCAQVGDEDAIAALVEAGRSAAQRAPATAARWFDAALRILPAQRRAAARPARAARCRPLGGGGARRRPRRADRGARQGPGGRCGGALPARRRLRAHRALAGPARRGAPAPAGGGAAARGPRVAGGRRAADRARLRRPLRPRPDAQPIARGRGAGRRRADAGRGPRRHGRRAARARRRRRRRGRRGRAAARRGARPGRGARARAARAPARGALVPRLGGDLPRALRGGRRPQPPGARDQPQHRPGAARGAADARRRVPAPDARPDARVERDRRRRGRGREARAATPTSCSGRSGSMRRTPPTAAIWATRARRRARAPSSPAGSTRTCSGSASRAGSSAA